MKNDLIARIQSGAVDADQLQDRLQTSEIDYIRDTFKLSQGEASFLTTCTRGQGLLKIGEDTAIISIEPTETEFEFVDTNINTVVQRRIAKENK